MELFQIEHLNFTYPGREQNALEDVSIAVRQGEFITLCGKSGCGKTTLLRLLKTSLAPYGEKSGSICFQGVLLDEVAARDQASQIGFVMQSPDNQIVTDKVWHELAFGLESLGLPTPEIRARVAEMASFFGIQTWFHKKVTELSGGQKQLLNLASVMVMQPAVLILDEPTGQLDPIAAGEFLKTLEKINRELGTTVILTEHRLEEVFPISDRVIVMEKGRIIADAEPREVAEILKSTCHGMYPALPAPMRIHQAVPNSLVCPLTVREGRVWLEEYAKEHPLKPEQIPPATAVEEPQEPAVELQDVWFRYEKASPDVIKGLNLRIGTGELFAILGGNGTGKTTALSLIAGLYKPYRGKVLIGGRETSKIPQGNSGGLGMLPQNPQALFVKKTVYLDLMEILSGQRLSQEEKEKRVENMAALCRIDELMECHPYDLSGGEQQRAAFAKVLLKEPELLILDEPTKGMDARFKQEFADILKELKAGGVTVVMVSHDIEFCAEYADRCAMFFDGTVTSVEAPRTFFAGKNFYTTSANRMARICLPDAVLAEDVILACGGTLPKKRTSSFPPAGKNQEKKPAEDVRKKRSTGRLIVGSIFAFLFLVTLFSYLTDTDLLRLSSLGLTDPFWLQLSHLVEGWIALWCFFPGKELGNREVRKPEETVRKVNRRTILAVLLILIAIPLTLYAGVHFFGNRKYYGISLLILFEIMLPFFLVFEQRKPQARELVLISVLCAVTVAGRAAFATLPQFKPVVALVILSGVCLGGETGFLVGAVSGFVSNFFFGQGPWTPWQMFALGIIGFLAGILFRRGLLKKTRVSLCLFGMLSALLIYGGIMNPSSVLLSYGTLQLQTVLVAYAAGFYFDLIHALSTGFFLWFLAEPMIDKLERVKLKYGLLNK